MSQGVIGADGTALLPAQATVAGPDGNADAGTVTIIVNPGIPEGITAVTNPAAMTGGRERETDEQFRDRYYQSVDFAGGVNADAIAAEILQYVEGVYSAVCYENDTDETDSSGMPPHSVEAVVYGGLDSDVAQAIYRRKAAGIQTHGTSSVEVIGNSGQTYNISFSRPSLVPVWIKITDLVVDEDRFPSGGMDQIKAALSEYIGSDETGGLSIGETVYYVQLPQRINGVPGVVDYKLQTSANGTTYGDLNITIGARQKAYTDDDHISITEAAGS